MSRLALLLVLLCVASPCGAQTLRDELRRAGIPARCEDMAPRPIKSLEHAVPAEKDQSCEPNLPVVVGTGRTSPLPDVIRKVNQR